MPTDIRTTAATMVRSGAGILAADESIATCSQRLTALGIEATEESRRRWREVLLGTPGLEERVSGVILFDETFRQADGDGTPFPQLLATRGILPGIKVDTGAKPLAGAEDETITEGLDGLRDRIGAYVDLGARFAKWRAVFRIGSGLPSGNAVHANAHSLARYAALCQEGGLVPIVEPEVLMAGDHVMQRCAEVTSGVLAAVFEELFRASVDLRGIVLKPSMVLPGSGAAPVSPQTVASRTVECLRDTVPASVAGIAFLSGGQGAALATTHLGLMNADGPHPWPLTFSYGRAIQDDVLKTWLGSDDNVDRARSILLDRVRDNGQATLGRVPDAA